MIDITINAGGEKITVRENFFDRIVRYLDPVKAQRRFQARAMMALSGSYIGASRAKRSLSQWRTSWGDADSDTLYDLPILRDRSRDLIRNAPLATGAINTVCTNVVGTGLKLQSRIDRETLGMDEEEADAWESTTEREFRLWAESQECDAALTLTFASVQNLVFRSALESGDVFILMPYIERSGSPYGLSLQVIEGDRVCNESNAPDGPEVSGGGVEKKHRRQRRVDNEESGKPLKTVVVFNRTLTLLEIRGSWKALPLPLLFSLAR